MKTIEKQIQATLKRIKPVSEEESRRWDWDNVIGEHLHNSGLPKRFWFEVEKWHPEQEAKFKEVKSLLKQNGCIIALVGPRGVGKTTLAAQLIIERAWNDLILPWHRQPPYRKLTDIIARLKPLYGDFGSIRSESLIEYRDSFCRDHPLVIIDEVMECEDQKFKDRVLTDILDRRYANLVDSIIISNQTPDDFIRETNVSTISRLSEHGRIIRCELPSFRSKF